MTGALVFDRVGEPVEVLRFDPAAEPRVGPDEARVAVAMRPIQPADIAFIRGRYRIRPEFPQPAGLEGVGRIVEAPAASGLVSGQRVAFRATGTWSNDVGVPLDRLIPVPDDVADTDACQISLNPMTAWGLLDQAGVRDGDWVILTAATSVVASLVIGLCAARGIHTVGVVRAGSSDGAERCAADLVLPADTPDLASAIKEGTGGGAAALLDCVGGPLVATLLGALTVGGKALAYGVLDGTPASITNALLIYGNLTWIGFGIDRWLAGQSPDQKAAAVADLWSMVRSGALRLPVAAEHPLENFAAALAADAAPGRVGKVLLI